MEIKGHVCIKLNIYLHRGCSLSWGGMAQKQILNMSNILRHCVFSIVANGAPDVPPVLHITCINIYIIMYRCIVYSYVSSTYPR